MVQFNIGYSVIFRGNLATRVIYASGNCQFGLDHLHPMFVFDVTPSKATGENHRVILSVKHHIATNHLPRYDNVPGMLDTTGYALNYYGELFQNKLIALINKA